jgi:hypothetical protein
LIFKLFFFESSKTKCLKSRVVDVQLMFNTPGAAERGLKAPLADMIRVTSRLQTDPGRTQGIQGIQGSGFTLRSSTTLSSFALRMTPRILLVMTRFANQQLQLATNK